jgi:hypothetical protein
MSGRKNNLSSFQIIPTQSGASTITSRATNIQFLDNIGIQINFTGTLSGTIAVQVSADYAQNTVGSSNVSSPGNWIPVPTLSAIIASSEPSSVYFDINQISSPYIQAVWTPTSGTGNITAIITAKQI